MALSLYPGFVVHAYQLRCCPVAFLLMTCALQRLLLIHMCALAEFSSEQVLWVAQCSRFHCQGFARLHCTCPAKALFADVDACMFAMSATQTGSGLQGLAVTNKGQQIGTLQLGAYGAQQAGPQAKTALMVCRECHTCQWDQAAFAFLVRRTLLSCASGVHLCMMFFSHCL